MIFAAHDETGCLYVIVHIFIRSSCDERYRTWTQCPVYRRPGVHTRWAHIPLQVRPYKAIRETDGKHVRCQVSISCSGGKELPVFTMGSGASCFSAQLTQKVAYCFLGTSKHPAALFLSWLIARLLANHCGMWAKQCWNTEVKL